MATAMGEAAGRLSRMAGRGDGSVIGGKIGLWLEPDLLSMLAAGRQVILVTGTNGKTTTTRLITAGLPALGQAGASHRVRAPMEGGAARPPRPAPDAPFALLAVDAEYPPP